MYKESKHSETIVYAYKHHILRSPLLTIELWFRTEALTITATVNPQSNRQFLFYLTWGFCPYVQI